MESSAYCHRVSFCFPSILFNVRFYQHTTLCQWLYSPDPLEPLPLARPLAYISMITGISHERNQQALTSPPYSYFHDNGASLTRPCGQRSIPSTFFSSTISGRNCWPSNQSSGRHNLKTRARRPFTSPKHFVFF